MRKPGETITYYVIDKQGNIVSGHFAEAPARRRALAIGGIVVKKEDYHVKRRRPEKSF